MAKRTSRSAAAGGTPATVALIDAGVAHALHPYQHQSGGTDYGTEAATALGVEPERLFKTLICDTGAGLVVAIVAVANSVDLKALAACCGVKSVQLADPAVAARSSGYVVGGISPLGQRVRLPTVLDSSAMSYELIMVSAGRRGLQVELAPADLVALTEAQVAAISR